MRTHARSVAAAALALAALGRGQARADELRSDEGVAIQVPAGWRRCTQKLNATTALAIERTDSGEPRPRIVVDTLPVQSVTEDRAFAIVREMLDRPGEVVERATGRFLKEEFDDDGPVGKLKHRVYAALRNKRVYCLMLETKAARFDEDARSLEEILGGIAFFVPEPRKPAVPAARPDAALASATDEAPVPSTERVPAAKPAAKPAEPKLAPPDTAPVTTPAAPGPAVVRRARSQNVLGPGSLVDFDDEYDPELWAAKHLVDPAARNGWCSSPSGHAPHGFVLELPRALDVARLAFDDACPADPGFEGAAAREVGVEGSSAGPSGPWRALGHVVLEKDKNDQPVDLLPNDGRWLRVSVLSNHGHPVLTQLVRIRAFASETQGAAPASVPVVTTDDGPFRLERVRVSLESKGAPLDPAVVARGEAFYVYFKPRAMQLSAAGECSLVVDLRFEDGKGEEKHAVEKVLEHIKPPAPPLSTYVSLKVELPATFPPGSYALRIAAHDREAGKDTQEKLPFEVKSAP